jgi:hypothetical protein
MHSVNEYWVIEGNEKVYGMAGAEKSYTEVIYNCLERVVSQGETETAPPQREPRRYQVLASRSAAHDMKAGAASDLTARLARPSRYAAW